MSCFDEFQPLFLLFNLKSMMQWKYTIIAILLKLSPLVLRGLQLLFVFIKVVMGVPKESALSLGDKSVKTPSAHNAILCEVRNLFTPVVKKAMFLSSEFSPWPLSLRVLIELQLLYGLRVSEALSIGYADLMALGRIRIRASKRGTSRIINYADRYGYLEMCRRNGVKPFADFNRFFIYREYKKHGIMLFHEKDKKYSVTHAFRHLLVAMLKSEIDDKSLISDLLGHKSGKSIESYMNG